MFIASYLNLKRALQNIEMRFDILSVESMVAKLTGKMLHKVGIKIIMIKLPSINKKSYTFYIFIPSMSHKLYLVKFSPNSYNIKNFIHL